MRSSQRSRAAAVATLVLGTATVHAQAPADRTRAAEPAVRAVYEAARRELPFDDRRDFDDARRGFIATRPDVHADRYAFLQAGDAPDTVHPSLWRLAQLNAIHGLFEVVPGVYQVRGFALANMTVIEGARGVIVVDPLGSVGAATAALDLYFAHRPRRPITAVIYTHSHSDHYGGGRAVADPAEVAAGRTVVIAPDQFLEEVIDESVVAGNAMGRRAAYQFGMPLPRGPRGTVDAGLGKIDSVGTAGRSMAPPTQTIRQPIERHTIDGVAIVFQLAPLSEAPAEMHLFLPGKRVLNLAENATHTMHNLLPLRGTEVRDARGWSAAIDAAIEQFGAETDVLIAQHHWPVWGRERITEALANQRDLYKFLHDQTVRLMNHGATPAEIAEALTLPPGLARDWAARGYYGTLSHNVKAVYQKYIGWYDGNPANLHPLPAPAAAVKYVEYMGGAEAVLTRARADFARGEFRWVAEALKHVVYADPANAAARALAADAFEQMGYAAESATWRNAYLLGAQELRQGPPAARPAVLDVEMVRAMPLTTVFDVLGTAVDAAKVWDRTVVVNWVMSDTKDQAAVTLRHGALTSVAGKRASGAAATVTLTRAVFDAIAVGRQTLSAAVAARTAVVEGDVAAAETLFGALDRFDARFPVVEPRRPRP